MIWLKTSKEIYARLFALCTKHAPELVEEMKKCGFSHDPNEPWQNQKTAVKIVRDRYQTQGSSEEIQVDDDAALAGSEMGVWVQGWLWVDKADLEEAMIDEVQSS